MTDPDAVPDTFTIKVPSPWVSAAELCAHIQRSICAFDGSFRSRFGVPLEASWSLGVVLHCTVVLQCAVVFWQLAESSQQPLSRQRAAPSHQCDDAERCQTRLFSCSG